MFYLLKDNILSRQTSLLIKKSKSRHDIVYILTNSKYSALFKSSWQLVKKGGKKIPTLTEIQKILIDDQN